MTQGVNSFGKAQIGSAFLGASNVNGTKKQDDTQQSTYTYQPAATEADGNDIKAAQNKALLGIGSKKTETAGKPNGDDTNAVLLAFARNPALFAGLMDKTEGTEAYFEVPKAAANEFYG
jgi:hypothetical protein